MNDFFEISAVLAVGLSSVLILKAFSFKGAPIVAALFIVCVTLRGGELLPPMLELFSYIPNGAEKYAEAALRIVGIGYIGGICADTCRELGEGGLARASAMITRFEMLALAYPYILEITEKCFALIGE